MNEAERAALELIINQSKRQIALHNSQISFQRRHVFSVHESDEEKMSETITVFIVREDGNRETAQAPVGYPEPGGVLIDLEHLELSEGDKYRIEGQEEWNAGGAPWQPKLDK